jgi:uncharacterized repeat protein (TIGR01451 family)
MKTIMTLSRFFFGTLLVLMTLFPFAGANSFLGGRSPAAEGDFVPGIVVPAIDCVPKDPPTPMVKIKVRVPACSEPGQTIEYRICVENCSPAEAHHVVVKNVLPANAKFLRADPMPVTPATPTKQGVELQWQLGTIGGGACREISLAVLPTNKEDVKNCFRVQFEHGQCVVTRQAASPAFPGMPGMPGHPGGPGTGLPGTGLPPIVTDPTKPPPKVVPVPEAVKPEDMPVLELSVNGPKKQYADLPSKYDITVTNKGKTKATDLQVSCLPAMKLKVVKSSAPGVVVDNEAVWNLGDLAPGTSKVVEVTLRAAEAGEFCFKVLAKAEPKLLKEVEYCTTFVGVSGMTVELSDRDDPVFFGHKTSYIVVIRTQGSAALTNVRLKAFVPDALKMEKANVLLEKQDPVKGGQWIEFKAMPKIDVGSHVRYEIFVEAILAGRTRFHAEVMADQLEIGRPVIVQELTTIVDDREQK